MLLREGSQLLEELAEDNGAVDGVLYSQRFGLLLKARRTSAAPKQGAVQRLAAIPYVCEGELSGVPSPRWTVRVTKNQVSERWLSTLHWKRRARFHNREIKL